MNIEAVIKLGGSLLAGQAMLPLLDALGRLADRQRLLLVPGGGALADAVRAACRRQDPGDSAAHWMAVLAMDQQAHYVAALAARACLVQTPEQIEGAAPGVLPVLAPYRWLREADALPHGWHVTSDSIAAWIAGRLNVSRLVLLKACDGVLAPSGELRSEVTAAEASRAGLVDEGFAEVCGPALECWLLNGGRSERLLELFSSGRTRGTRVRRGSAPGAAPAPGGR